MELNKFEVKLTIFSNEKITEDIIEYLKTKSKKSTYEYFKERPLTKREIEVLKLVIDGKSNLEISDKLNITIHTVKAHISSILDKLCVTDRIQAAVKATKENLI